jgi:Zn-dependent protease
VFLAEPQQTRFDLNFSLLGIPVRISPFFWVLALVFGWGLTDGLPLLLALWVIAVLVSLMVHEFGHALAFRACGIQARVVLYHFGGLAIPEGSSWWVGAGRMAPRQQIFISAAGPVAQLALAAVILAIVRASGHVIIWPRSLLGAEFPFNFYGLVPTEMLWGSGNPPAIAIDPLNDLLLFLVLPSVFWAVLNLIPVYPLDGGQIAREVCVVLDPRSGIRNSLILSIVAGALVGVGGLMIREWYLGIMFGMLAFSSYQLLQAYSGRGGGFGGGPWGGGGGGGPW